jgi:indoleacetamide hydrolase
VTACLGGAAETAAAIREGATTSTEVVQRCIDRSAAIARLNAFISLDGSGALAAAAAADEVVGPGARLGPLHGVPIVVKDNIHVAGTPTTAGTRALAHRDSTQDAPVVEVLRNAGAIVIAKTNMHELAFGISGYNLAFHDELVGVRNPFDVERFAGGSSSGTAVAVSARAAPAGLGTDTGGSVRIPAAMCGVVGFRPTVGRYSQVGTVPISRTRDTIGPIGVNVADVRLLDDVITGNVEFPSTSIEGLRLGIARALFWDDLDDDTEGVFAEALSRLESAGAVLVDVEMPDLADLNANVGGAVAIFEAYGGLVEYLARHAPDLCIEDVVDAIASPDVRETYAEMVLPGRIPGTSGWLPVDEAYERAVGTYRPALQRAYAEAFQRAGVDAMVFATTPCVAVPQGPEASSAESFMRFIRHTDPGSNAGIPGISMPAGIGARTGLPVGLELDGPAGADRRLLSVAATVERALAPSVAPPIAHDRVQT